jgi:serine/threonine protein kinase
LNEGYNALVFEIIDHLKEPRRKAMKVSKSLVLNKEEEKQVEMETKLLMKVNSPNVIILYESFYIDCHYYSIFELCQVIT